MYPKFFKHCSTLLHIRKAIREKRLAFYEELSHVYHRQFKQAIKNYLSLEPKLSQRNRWFY